MVTITDVAKRAGVSISTVSRVLNRVDSVSEEMSRKVKEAVEELGYVPNSMAQSLKQNCSHMIGITASDLAVPFFPEIVKGIEKRFLPDGYVTITSNTYDQEQIERCILENMVSRRVDALLVNSTGKNERFLKDIADSGTPVLFYDRRPQENIFPAVYADKQMAMEIALKHLIEKGHQRIMLVTGSRLLNSNYDRYMGVQRFIFNNDLDPADFSFRFGTFSPEEGLLAMEEIIETAPDKRPTAVITGSVAITAGILDYCRSHGICIPRDIALVSTGTFMYEEAIDCRLTYLDDCIESVTSNIVGMLEKCLIDQLPLQNIQMVERPVLHVGNTT